MSNDILIDDSSAMAGNLVTAVDSIAKAVSESSSTFNASFDNLAKEFSGSISKVTDSVKSMHNDLLRAIDKVNVNVSVTKNIRQSSTKSKDKSDDKSIMLELQAEQLNAVRQKYAEEQAIMAELRDEQSKHINEKKAEEKTILAQLASEQAKAISEKMIEEQSIMADLKAEQIKFISDKKNEEKVIMAELAAEQAKAISDKMIEEKTIMAELFAEQKKMANEKWLEEKAMMNELLKEEKDAIKRKEQEEKLIRQQLADEERKSIAQAGFTSFAASAFPDELAAMGKSSKGKVSASDTGWLQSLSDFSKSFEKIPLSNFEQPKAEDIYPVKEMQQASSALLEGTSSFFNVMKKVDSFSILAEQPSRPTEGFEKPVQSEFTTYGVKGEQPALKSRRKITRDMLSQLAVGEEVTPFVGPKNITEDQRNAIEASKAIPGSQVGPMPQPPSYMSQFNQNLAGGAKFFGNALSPIFQGLAQTFGKKVSPFLANPITKAGMNLAQGGMQYAQTGNLGIAGGRASAAIGGGATAALGVGLAGFGVALSAVTGAVTIAGQAIQSMSSYVAKFSPAAAERMNLVFNDLQGVIGKALLPVFEMAIPIVRQFADFVHSAMQALAPSISIVKESFAEIVPPLIELGAVLIDAFMPVIKFAAGLIYGLTQILVPLINGFSALVETASMMAEIFSGGISITDIMINGFKLLGDITNIVVGAFNWMVAAFYAGTGSILKFASWLIDWVDGVGQSPLSKSLEEMGDNAVKGATKLEDVAKRQMDAGMEGKKFEYKAGEIKGKGGIKSGSSVGMAVREAQSMSIESLGDAIRKAAITAQAPEQKDRQEEYMKTVSENTAYDKQKKAMLDAIKESGLVDGNETPFWDSLTEMDTDYSGGGGSFAPNGVA